MCRSDHFDVQVHFLDLAQLGADLRAIRHDDVRVIFLGLFQTEAELMRFIKQLEADDMLAESIVGEDDLGCCVIGQHIVWPMDQRHFHECKLMLAGAQGIAGLDPVIFHILEVLLHHVVGAGVGRICLGLRINVHHLGESAGMIRLRMLDDDVIDGPIADDAADALQQLIGKFRFHGIEQRDLLVNDQIGVVSGAFLYWIKASVKVAVILINEAGPPNIFFDFEGVFSVVVLPPYFFSSVV